MTNSLTEDQIQQIGRVYDGKTETIDHLVRRFKCSRRIVTNAASRLGLTRGKRPWTTTDEQYLRKHWGRISTREIAKTLDRTEISLTVRVKRLGISMWDIADEIGYNVRDLEMLTKVDHRFWRECMDAGELKHTMLSTYDSNTVVRAVRIQDLHRFLRRRPEFMDYRAMHLHTRTALELDKLPDPPRFKKITCRSKAFDERTQRFSLGDRVHHGSPKFQEGQYKTRYASCARKPFSFWVPTYDANSQCPRCGSIVTRLSEQRAYRDDAPGQDDILCMLAGKLGLNYHQGKILDKNGQEVPEQQLLEYAFNTGRNAGKAFRVFSRLLESGLSPIKDRNVPASGVLKNLMDFDLSPRQNAAWQEFLTCSNVGIYWPPGEGKMFFAAYACGRLPGRHLLFVNSTTLSEQWATFFTDHAGCPVVRKHRKPACIEVSLFDTAGKPRCTIEIFNYATRHAFSGEYGLIVYDEMHFLPGNNAHRLAMITSRYRVGLTATPFREDGRAGVLQIITGRSIGTEWAELLAERKAPIASIRVLVVEDLEAKYGVLPAILGERDRTIVFCDSLRDGHRLSAETGMPFIHAETRQRLRVIAKHKKVILSRVGDHGLDIRDLNRVIEFNFHGGSRAQELQRYGRLLHSLVAKEHVILMTREEFTRYHKRLSALEGKGLRFTIDVSTDNTRKRDQNDAKTWLRSTLTQLSLHEDAHAA